MPDHDVLFAQLRQRVCEQISPHVVVLRSRDCNTGTHSTPKFTRPFTAKWHGMGLSVCRNEGYNEGNVGTVVGNGKNCKYL